MSLADRSKREVLDRLRLTEGQLGLAVQRIAELEAEMVRKDAMISALCARFDDDEEAIDEVLRNAPVRRK